MKLEDLDFLAKEDKDLVAFLLDNYEVTLDLDEKIKELGLAHLEENRIVVNVLKKRTKNRKIFLSVFFHELSHIIRFRQRPSRYVVYTHNETITSVKSTIKVIKSLYKEELFTDILGEKLAKKYLGDNFRYHQGYTNPEMSVKSLFLRNNRVFQQLMAALLDDSIDNGKKLNKKLRGIVS